MIRINNEHNLKKKTKLICIPDRKKWNLTLYSMYIEKSGNLIDEVGLIISAITIKKHIAVLLRGFTWWTTREDQDWSKCEVLFAYTGKMKFVLIEKIDMSLLNEKVAKGSKKRVLR